MPGTYRLSPTDRGEEKVKPNERAPGHLWLVVLHDWWVACGICETEEMIVGGPTFDRPRLALADVAEDAALTGWKKTKGGSWVCQECHAKAASLVVPTEEARDA